MSNLSFNSLRDVCPGSYKWRVKVRIIRIWRGVSRIGEQFKGFNLLLLDDKNYRLHAFVPGAQADEKAKIIKLGSIYKIYNFTVKDYQMDEKFRCIQSDKQIIFTTYTKVEEIFQDDGLIPNNAFDFYDLEDLKGITNHNTYLTDVIGVMEKEQPLEDLTNTNGQKQVKMQFSITDGSNSVRVSFWDSLAKDLDKALKADLERPIIIIIASCKITSWQDVPYISSATATSFYLNYNHHSVVNMRKLLSTPIFAKHDFSSQKEEKIQTLKVEAIRNLSSDYILKEVICKATIVNVEPLEKWFMFVCTSCYREIDLVEGKHTCFKCNRNVPYPEKRFIIYAEAMDETGKLDIVLFDREIRTLLGKSVYEVEAEEKTERVFPNILKSIQNYDYSIKLKIAKYNIEKSSAFYRVTDVVMGFCDAVTNMPEESMGPPNVQSMLESSSSTIHLDGLSQLNVQTPVLSKQTMLDN